MFKLRHEQMISMGRQHRDRFVSLLADYVTAHFRKYVVVAPLFDMKVWVDMAVKKAEGYEVSTEPECAQLVLLLLPLGLNADERLPWVRETLTDSELTPVGKVRRLAELARVHQVPDIDDVVVYDFMEV